MSEQAMRLIERQEQFPASSRVLHWLMAIMVLSMLFIGIGMAATESDRYRVLVSIHKPLGISILILVIIRMINRLLNPPPPLPVSLPRWQRIAAEGSHYMLYALMLLMPLIGWGMLSAEPYPVVLAGSLSLPPILPQNATLYATLRQLHTVLAYLFFLTVLLHFGAALFHGLVRRDGVFDSMASFGWSRPGGRGLRSHVERQPMMESNAAPLREDAHLDQLLDEALEHTFPASDPIAVGVERKLPSRPVR